MADNNTENVASLIELAGEITIAWLQNPNVKPAPQDVPGFLKDMHAAIAELSSDKSSQPETVTYEPAVSPRSSVKPDHIVSLIDGKKYKTLKRHLALHGLKPAEYRERYGLKADYPMVAPEYAAQRREIAKTLGLGRKRVAAEPVTASDAAPKAGAKPADKTKAPAAKTLAAPDAKAATSPVRAARKAKAPPVTETGEAPASKAAKTAPAKAKPASVKAAKETTASTKAKSAPKPKAAPAQKATKPAGKSQPVTPPTPETQAAPSTDA